MKLFGKQYLLKYNKPTSENAEEKNNLNRMILIDYIIGNVRKGLLKLRLMVTRKGRCNRRDSWDERDRRERNRERRRWR